MSREAEAYKARSEFERTEAAFGRVRAKLIEQVIGTAVGESALRDKLVLTIQALEGVQKELLAEAALADVIDAARED